MLVACIPPITSMIWRRLRYRMPMCRRVGADRAVGGYNPDDVACARETALQRCAACPVLERPSMVHLAACP